MKKGYILGICALLAMTGCAKQTAVSSVGKQSASVEEKQPEEKKEEQDVVETHTFYEDAELKEYTNDAGEKGKYSYLSVQNELNEDEIKEWYLQYVTTGIAEKKFDYAVIKYDYSTLDVEEGIYGNQEYIFIDVVLSKKEDGSYNLPEACPALQYTDGKLEIVVIE